MVPEFEPKISMARDIDHYTIALAAVLTREPSAEIVLNLPGCRAKRQFCSQRMLISLIGSREEVRDPCDVFGNAPQDIQSEPRAFWGANRDDIASVTRGHNPEDVSSSVAIASPVSRAERKRQASWECQPL